MFKTQSLLKSFFLNLGIFTLFFTVFLALNQTFYGNYRLYPSIIEFFINFGLVVLFFLTSAYLVIKKAGKLLTKIALLIFAIIFSFIGLFVLLGMVFSSNGMGVAADYSCDGHKYSAIEHFKEGVDIYRNKGIYLERISPASSGNLSTYPKKYGITFYPEISREEVIKIVKCIPKFDLTVYSNEVKICELYKCYPDDFKPDSNKLNNLPDVCYIQKNNGKIIRCDRNYAPENGDPVINPYDDPNIVHDGTNCEVYQDRIKKLFSETCIDQPNGDQTGKKCTYFKPDGTIEKKEETCIINVYQIQTPL
jgi:hypothetical protein